ncbi:MAG: enoyl-CoA hydratase-related protein [Solirubrobacteraceae bacterium]
MSYDHVIYEKRSHVAYVTLNRPERMNALDKHSHGELIEIFDDFAADADSWVAIITGAGERAFSAGNDLKATAEASANGEQRVSPRSRFAAITRGYECPKPLIAAVNGVAAGGGFEIALACDLVIAADTARFALPEPRVGLIAGAGGLHRLSRQIPLKHAMGMLLTGRFVSAQEGYRLGFVNEVVPAAELMQAAERWASQILECSPLLVQLTKEAVKDGFGLAVEDAIARDWEERIPRMLASEDYIEGPKAFSEKRKPAWTGR